MNYFAFAVEMARAQFGTPSADVASGTDGGHRGNDSPAPNPPTEPYSVYPRNEGDIESDWFEHSDDNIYGNEQEHR